MRRLWPRWQGRATRKEFFSKMLLWLLFWVVLVAIGRWWLQAPLPASAEAMEHGPLLEFLGRALILMAAGALYVIVTIAPMAALCIRRYRDAGISPYWLLAQLALAVGGLLASGFALWATWVLVGVAGAALGVVGCLVRRG